MTRKLNSNDDRSASGRGIFFFFFCSQKRKILNAVNELRSTEKY